MLNSIPYWSWRHRSKLLSSVTKSICFGICLGELLEVQYGTVKLHIYKFTGQLCDSYSPTVQILESKKCWDGIHRITITFSHACQQLLAQTKTEFQSRRDQVVVDVLLVNMRRWHAYSHADRNAEQDSRFHAASSALHQVRWMSIAWSHFAFASRNHNLRTLKKNSSCLARSSMVPSCFRLSSTDFKSCPGDKWRRALGIG